ncbi:MAG: class IV adenylate cyclase [Chloroflexi bacterium]|nr:class IV adenylate cyclase [Chloroflexota bacterium]
MTTSGRHIEREVKFWVRDLARIRQRLEEEGARLVQPRGHEFNLRFDTPDRALARQHRVLRLRQDRGATLTYKGPGDPRAVVAAREEIEVPIGDFAAARRLLEALGYQVVLEYEKYRTVYAWGATQVMLDETPLGAFVEIEGPAVDEIRAVAAALNLRWEHRLTASYAALFERLRGRLTPAPRHLTFAALRPHQPLPPDWLPVPPADAAA